MIDAVPNHPLARAYRLSELPGRLAKWLTVPEGRQGVVLPAAGSERLLQPGLHRVLSVWERLLGRRAGLRVGFVPADPISARLRADYLLSGDGQLVDASLSLVVQVSDPALFFTQQVLPRGEIRSICLELSDQDVREALGPLVRRYAAEDLLHELPGPRLANELLSRLELHLRGLGLQAKEAQLLTFWRSEERAEVAERVQALSQRLQDVELEKQMAALENEAQLKDFVQQLSPGLEDDLGLHAVAEAVPAVGEPSPDAAPSFPTLGDSFRKWVIGQVGVDGDFWPERLARLLGRSEEGQMQASALQVSGQPGFTTLDELVRGDRAGADRLVREQAGGEVLRIAKILNELRSRVYQQGEVELALRLRDLERRLERYHQDILQPNYGRPPYLTDLQVKRNAWATMLGYDEDLLLYASALGDKAQDLQAKYTGGEAIAGLLASLEEDLDRLHYRFAGRERAVKPATERLN